MKWTIHELIKSSKTDTDLDYSLDLNHFITDEIDDLVRMSETKVTGFYDYYEDEELFVFDLMVNTKLIMLCALTLEEVEVEINFNAQLNYSTDPIDDDTHLIKGITVELDQYIFSEILVEKPMKVYAQKALENYHEDIYEIPEDELVTSSPFAEIKK